MSRRQSDLEPSCVAEPDEVAVISQEGMHHISSRSSEDGSVTLVQHTVFLQHVTSLHFRTHASTNRRFWPGGKSQRGDFESGRSPAVLLIILGRLSLVLTSQNMFCVVAQLRQDEERGGQRKVAHK